MKMRCGPCLALVLLGTALSLPLLCPAAAEPDRDSLLKVLAFHASFDGQADADFARGDKKIYTASNLKRTDAKAGLHRADVEIAKGKGKFGDALRFGKNEKAVVFY
jgi:hypothetical protein